MQKLVPVILFLLVTLNACMTKKSTDILIVRSENGHFPHELYPDSIKAPIVFSNEFWQYFSTAFPYATMGLFNNFNDPSNTIQLSDTTYLGVVIHPLNSLPILNRLPKDLSKELSEAYFKEGGFFILPSDSTEDGKEEKAEAIQWKQASRQVQREYLQFIGLLRDFDKEFAIIARKEFINDLLHQYR